MRHPRLPHLGPLNSALALVIVSIICDAQYAPAEAPPSFAFSFGSNQIPSGIFPVAVGTSEAGKVYISSLWNVIEVDTNGAFLDRWGTQGTGPGQFSYAGQLAFDHAGHIYVLDAYNGRIEEFSTNGVVISAWGSQSAGSGQFDQPAGLAVNPAGRIYVADSLNSRIQVFSSPGVFLKQFGQTGTNAGEFSFPGVITLDSSNNLYVVDSAWGNFRVQKFDPDGNFLLQWIAYAPDNDGIIEIGGITADPANNIYVSDAAHNRIQKFSSDGVLLSQWGSQGNGPGQFNGPMGIAVDPTGNYLYVPDYYNGRIDVFAYSALAPIMYQAPTNQVVPAGATLTILAGVFGAQPLTYQWAFNGLAVPGVTGSALVLTNVALADSGSYSVSVSNSLGAVASPNAIITVLPAVVTTLPPSGLTATGAVLHGNAWIGGNATTAWFEWGATTNYGNSIGLTNLAANTTNALSQTLSNLAAEVVYHYRLAGSNSLGAVFGTDVSFEVGLKPAVVTLPPVPAGLAAVLLSANVNPEARDTSAFFRWGRSLSEHTTPTNRLPSLVAPVTVQNTASGLQPGLIYMAQPVASNELGTAEGQVINFIAPPWVLLPVPRNKVWAGISLSADATRLAAVANGPEVDVSADGGLSWSNHLVPSASLHSIAMSADGARLVAGVGATFPGPAYVSTNSGISWIKANGPNRNWYALASSADGLRVAGVDLSDQLVITSTNGGLDWQTNSPPAAASWDTVASSADGLRLIVAADGVRGTTNGVVYTSRDAGQSWTSNSLPTGSWRAVASSADGRILLTAAGGLQGLQPGPIYISTNSGDSWALTGAPVTNWQAVAISADGSTLAALVHLAANPVYTSTNLGLTWHSQVLPQALWSDLVLSADGAKIFASADQNIFTLQTAAQPRLNLGLTKGQLSLSWVLSSSSVVTLQRSSDLSAAQWTDLPVTPITDLTNLRQQITLPLVDATSFYRLRATQ